MKQELKDAKREISKLKKRLAARRSDESTFSGGGGSGGGGISGYTKQRTTLADLVDAAFSFDFDAESRTTT